MITRTLLLGLLGAVAVPALSAQTAAPDSAPPSTPPAPTRLARASWTSDRMPLQPGDLITIVVDEQTAASERVSNVATGSRSQRAGLNANISTDAALGPNKGFGTSMDNSSRDIGEAGRRGDLTAVLTVRVVEVEPNGVVKIQGSKRVVVDGREQQVSLEGLLRPEDVHPGNVVFSDRIAEAVITYRGKKIGPRTGILGRILSILWP